MDTLVDEESPTPICPGGPMVGYYYVSRYRGRKKSDIPKVRCQSLTKTGNRCPAIGWYRRIQNGVLVCGTHTSGYIPLRYGKEKV